MSSFMLQQYYSTAGGRFCNSNRDPSNFIKQQVAVLCSTLSQASRYGLLSILIGIGFRIWEGRKLAQRSTCETQARIS